MNAKEFAHELEKAASFIRQQQAEIETYKLELYDEVMLKKEQKAKIEALKNLIEAQDEKIVELAFRAVYAERGNEIVREANARSRP